MKLASIIASISLHNPFLAALAIILATFIHEDLATIATGVAVSEGAVGTEVALPALYAGIILGDLGLYGLGRLVALNRLSLKILNRKRMVCFKGWLSRRVIVGAFCVRFLPGLRFTAYTTYGFFAAPLVPFTISVIMGTSIWTTGLFYLSSTFGAITANWLGIWRWPAVLLAFLVPLMLLRRLVRSDPSLAAGPDVDAQQQ